MGLLLGIAQQGAWGQAASRPATPCPCAADGVCRPKRESWGWHQTRWRPWPGDEASKRPTLAAEGVAEETIEEGLPHVERPSAEQEDLRAMPKKQDAKDEYDVTEPAAEPPTESLPALEDQSLPALEDQSRIAPMPLILPAARDVAMRPKEIPQPLPAVNPAEPPTTIKNLDDAPPALPSSLKRQVAHNRGLSTPAMLPAIPAPMRVSAGNAPSKVVVPAGWQQPVGIRLINPAAALVPEPTGDQLRQAIYYEATDQTTEAGGQRADD